MALVTCPECGRENVSDKTISCPSCGYNVREHFENLEKLDVIEYIENTENTDTSPASFMEDEKNSEKTDNIEVVLEKNVENNSTVDEVKVEQVMKEFDKLCNICHMVIDHPILTTIMLEPFSIIFLSIIKGTSDEELSGILLIIALLIPIVITYICWIINRSKRNKAINFAKSNGIFEVNERTK